MKAPWAAFALATLASAKPSCRCLYGEPCWPRQSDFASLASRLSQPLLHPLPPASACYPASNSSGNCTDVLANTQNGRWRSDQPGAMQAPNFETYTFDNGTISACYLNTTLGVPCDQGSVPVDGIDARTVPDVQAAVNFAAQHNLRFVVKNTGHDFLGRSTARGAFLLWMHNFKNITYHDTFVPDGAPSDKNYSKVITFGAGVQWYEAYAAAKEHSRFIVGGISASGSVGAVGGWIQGAGHSEFSPRHGLGVDNVIQFTVVTSSGKFLTVNSHQNSDLFWALRGGGGGTYAVVTSATYMTHDPFPLTAMTFSANFSSTQEAKTIIGEYVKMCPRLTDEGWGGYAFLTEKNLSFILAGPNISTATANTTFESFTQLSSNVTNGRAGGLPMSFDSFSAFIEATDAQPGQVGNNTEMASRLAYRDLTENNSDKVADVMLSLEGGVGIDLVAGGAVAKADPDATGLNPGWRKAVFQMSSNEEWPEGAPVSVIKQVHQRLRSKLDKLEGLAPGSAAYFNEASLYEKNFKQTFFGSHYGRLKGIKAKYDPNDMFVVPSGVGSEEWDEELRCRR